MPSTDTDNSIPIQTSGLTAFIATDYVGTAGVITGHYQMIKLAYGSAGAATTVNSSTPLPVSIAGGLTATISGFTGVFSVQGIGGAPVVVSGSVSTTGLTSSPLYVRTTSGFQVEVTGGRQISKSNDSISVYGPSGLTYIYTQLVGSTGVALSTTNGALNVNISGATINATIPSTVTVVGLSGATAVNVTIGNTVGINDTAILAGMTSVYNQLVTLNSNISSIAGVVPTGITGGRVTATTAVSQLDSGGYTCSNGVNVKSSSANTDIIYLNSSGISASGIGYELDPGQAFFIKVNNTNKIYMKAKSGSQIISFLAS
jgi:hypothetical protein